MFVTLAEQKRLTISGEVNSTFLFKTGCAFLFVDETDNSARDLAALLFRRLI